MKLTTWLILVRLGKVRVSGETREKSEDSKTAVNTIKFE